MVVWASSASASITIGQLSPTTPATAQCSGSVDVAAGSVTAGNTYTMPETGTITSWTTNSTAAPNQELTMKVYRKLSGSTYQAVGHDGPQHLAAGGTAGNTFATSIPVKAGDVLGDQSANAATVNNACDFVVTGSSIDVFLGASLADGASQPFTTIANHLPNVTAVLEPTNTFSVQGTTRNKKKGTAVVTVTLPNPGELSATGKGVKSGAAVPASAVSAPGNVKLSISAKGKQRTKLVQTGAVKLSATITYTPTGGAAGTQSIKLKLKKKL
jgi:hypothetical protein